MIDVLELERAKALLSLDGTESEEQIVLPGRDYAPAMHAGYRFNLLLGRSTYTEVFRAVCSKTDRDVVVKLAYASERVTTGERAEHIIHAESAVLSQLAGPGVVPMIETATASFGSFLVTQYAGECDLLTYCRDTCNTFTQCSELIQGLLKTLAAIHRRGWVHGDLKPQHVLVDSGHPVLIDFGLAATVQDGLIKSRCIGGTKGYIAPEILNGSASRPAQNQDVFSLGKMIEGVAAIHPPTRSKPLRRVIQRATHPNPELRHQDAGVLRSDFEAALAAQSRRGVYFTAACVVACASIAPTLMMGPDEASQSGYAEYSGEQVRPTFPHLAGLVTTNPGQARQLIAQLPSEMKGSWEAGYLGAAAQGAGTALPFGPDPFGETLAMSPRFDTKRRLLVWGDPTGKLYRLDDRGRHLIGDFPREAYTFSLDLHPVRDETLVCTALGSVYTLSPDGPVLVAAAEQAIMAWYSSDGAAIYAHSRDRAELVLIDRATQQVRWRLPTGGGSVFHAASNADDVVVFHDLKGSWSMTGVKSDGALGTPQALPNISQSVLSFDRDPEDGRLAIGTYDGIIHVNDSGTWHVLRCSESMQVYQVRLVSSEDRLFASTPADIEVFDLKTGLGTIPLGGRETYHQGVQWIDWSQADRSLIAVSGRGVSSWSAGPLP